MQSCTVFSSNLPLLFTGKLLHLPFLCLTAPKACRQQKGAPCPARGISLYFPARHDQTGFISSLALLCLTRSVISVAPLYPADLTADRAQPRISPQLPALSFDLMELAASPSRTRAPHCLIAGAGVWLPSALLIVTFQTSFLHVVLSVVGHPALNQWLSALLSGPLHATRAKGQGGLCQQLTQCHQRNESAF